MALITTGTALLTVPIPLPFLNVKLLGLIMIVAGLVKARALQRTSSWLWRNRRVRNGPGQPEPSRPAGIALITTGTVLLLAVSIPLPFLNVKLLGLIMIVAGLVKARALQRTPAGCGRTDRKVMAARVALETLLEANAPVARTAGRAPINWPAVGSQSPLLSLPITKRMVSATLLTR